MIIQLAKSCVSFAKARVDFTLSGNASDCLNGCQLDKSLLGFTKDPHLAAFLWQWKIGKRDASHT